MGCATPTAGCIRPVVQPVGSNRWEQPTPHLSENWAALIARLPPKGLPWILGRKNYLPWEFISFALALASWPCQRNRDRLLMRLTVLHLGRIFLLTVF